MARKRDEEVLAVLLQEKKNLEEQIKGKQEAIDKRNREKHEERLKIYGALLLHELQTGKRDETQLMQELDAFLTSNKDRAVVGLPLYGIGGKRKKNDAGEASTAISEENGAQVLHRPDLDLTPAEAPPHESQTTEEVEKPAAKNGKAVKTARSTAASTNASSKQGKLRSSTKPPEEMDADLAAHFS